MAKPSITIDLPLDTLKGFLMPYEQGSLIMLKVKPNAKKERLYVSESGELTLSVHAVAADNAANSRVIELLSGIFFVPKSRIEIMSGATARIKKIMLRGLS